MQRLKNKIALVTGAGSGIGKAIAEHFTKEGATVIYTDVNANSLPANAKSYTMDVTDETQINQTIQSIIENIGHIDILVSNAGIQHIAPIQELAFADWQKMLNIHLNGAFLTTKACLPHMYQQKSGCIIYIGSAHSKLASPLKAPYVTAKHGLLGLCRTVAKEAAPYNVRANVICPGYVLTPLVEKQIPEQAQARGITEQEVIENILLKDTIDHQFTTLEDISETAVFFAAFPSNALSGQSLLVSHGWGIE